MDYENDDRTVFAFYEPKCAEERRPVAPDLLPWRADIGRC